MTGRPPPLVVSRNSMLPEPSPRARRKESARPPGIFPQSADRPATPTRGASDYAEAAPVRATTGTILFLWGNPAAAPPRQYSGPAGSRAPAAPDISPVAGRSPHGVPARSQSGPPHGGVSSPRTALRAPDDGQHQPWTAARPVGPPPRANSLANHAAGSTLPLMPGPGMSPGRRPERREGREVCGSRPQKPSARALLPELQMQTQRTHCSARGIAPGAGRRKGSRPRQPGSVC